MGCNVAVLVSGGGTDLQSILDAQQQNSYPARVRVVISNKASAYGLERARLAGIRTEHISVKTEGSFDGVGRRMVEVFEEEQTELIVLAGYLKLVHPAIIRAYNHRIINIHPALLPKYGGKGMYGMKVHEAVIAAGETVSGPTVHFVDEVFDHGEIIAQRTVPVLSDDTPETLQRRVLEEEHRLLPEVVGKLAGGEIPLGIPK
jgi:phosphoribosylglycinamide formyltransferase-1